MDEKVRAGLKMIKCMKMDIETAKQDNRPLVIEGPALDALLRVVEIAEHVTLKSVTPLIGANGKALVS